MFETPGRIEPCFFEEHIPASLADLSVEIQREAAVLGQGLHPDSAAELADLVRVMNCYYSNLIEGHNIRGLTSRLHSRYELGRLDRHLTRH